MIRLTKMNADDFRAYLERAIPDCAQSHVRAGNWAPEEALERSRKEFETLLPDGVDSPQHFVCTLLDAESGEEVGWLWYWINPQRPIVSFIYDFEIFESFRRRGYGSQALAALEETVKPLGVKRIELHVFGNNTAARDLYKKSGFIESNVLMSKEVAH